VLYDRQAYPCDIDDGVPISMGDRVKIKDGVYELFVLSNPYMVEYLKRLSLDRASSDTYELLEGWWVYSDSGEAFYLLRDMGINTETYWFECTTPPTYEQLVIRNKHLQAFEDEHPRAGGKIAGDKQARREHALEQWLEDNQEIECNGMISPDGTKITKRDVWDGLFKRDPHLFIAGSKGSINAFFLKQNLCKFSPGNRRK